MKLKRKKVIGSSILAAGIICMTGVGALQSQANQSQPVPIESMETVSNDKETEMKDQKQKEGILKSDEWYRKASIEAIEKYFGLDDIQSYNSSVQYISALPEYELASNMSVLLWPKGEAQELAVEDLEKSHMVQFTEEGELEAVFISPDRSSSRQTPASVEDAKKITREFITQNKLAGDQELECLGGAYITSEAISVAFQYGEDQFIELGMDINSGNVYYFQYTTKEGAMQLLTPIKEEDMLG